MPPAAPFAREISCNNSTAWQVLQAFAAIAEWRVPRPSQCGNQQPIHVISSSLYLVQALHANGALQQAAGDPMST